MKNTTTVGQLLKLNIQSAISALGEFNYEVKDKVKVKALGNGEYRVWCGNWDYLPSKEDVFDYSSMYNMVESFIEWHAEVDVETVGNTWRHDGYSIIAGEGEDDSLSADTLADIDCRMMNYDESELDLFWSDIDGFASELNDIIDNSNLVVYHRKGKKWSIAPEVGQIEVSFFYFDEERDVEESSDYIEGYVAFHVDGYDEKVKKLESMIQGAKDDLELRCIASMLHRKLSSLESFLPDYLDDELVRDKAFEFCYKYYQENNGGPGWNNGFKGDFPDFEDRDTFLEFMQEFDQFKHQPELAIKDSMKLYKLGQKLNFEASFDLNSDTIALEFMVNEQYSVHITANEFEECDCNWMDVYREYVLPNVQRRITLDKMEAIKSKVGANLKEYAKNFWVRFEDSLQSGNCLFGSENFIKRHNISLEKLGAIRGDMLLELENSSFTQRIIFALAAKKEGVM